MEISCFVIAKSRTKPMFITYDTVKKTPNMLGQLLGASFYLIALLIFRLWGKAGMEVSLGVGLEEDWGTHTPQPDSGCNFRLYSQPQCGVWILSAGLITEKFWSACWYRRHQRWNEGFSSPLQENSLLPSKSELGKKLLPCKSRVFAAQFKPKGESRKTAAAHPTWWDSCSVLRLDEVNGFQFCNAAMHSLCRNLPAWLHRQSESYSISQRKDRSPWKKILERSRSVDFWGLHTLCLGDPYRYVHSPNL